MQTTSPARSAHVIVIGNEKGGSGKSTTAMHLIVALMQAGKRVGVIDLDVRQGTLSRYLENRAGFAERQQVRLIAPTVYSVDLDDLAGLEDAIANGRATQDILLIDCPGADTPLSRRAHQDADTLITPLNDSFVDFDVLGTVDPDSLRVLKPSHYAEMVWDCRKRRAMARRPAIDWIVMRNRLSTLDARNKRDIGAVLLELGRRIGFRTAPGFSERVIFRELFLKGLTLLDLREAGAGLSVSHVAARQEVRALLTALQLEGVGSSASSAPATGTDG
ncbi:MAG: division plane positioning ATPase MipZ [Alphaproteobacteria bacterium]|nr:division plane positioning ATPase MipZ [Alphaproteobacteria bacterium]